MIGLAVPPALLTFLSTAVLPQSDSAVDSLLVLAERGELAVLTVQVADRPDEVREAVRQLLTLAVSVGAPREQDEYLAWAERLGAAFADAWRDSILLRKVERFRRRSPSDRQAYVTADSLRRAGNAALYSAGVQAALRSWRQSLDLFTQLNDTAGMAAALGNIGTGFYLADMLDSASINLRRARSLSKLAGDLRVEGNVSVNLGHVASERGDLRLASEFHWGALRLHERVGNYRGMAADHSNLGIIARELGDLVRARQSYQTALALNRQYENLSPAATNLLNLGNLAGMQGNYVDAVALYREALSTYRDLDEPVNAADVLYNLGLLEKRRGDYPHAADALSEALAIYEATGNTADAISARQALATAHAAMGNLDRALAELAQADAAAREEQSDPATLAGLALARGDLALQLNMLSEADQQYAGAVRLYREARDAAGLGEAQQGRGVLLLLREDFTAARDVLELAARAQQDAGDARAAAWTHLLSASAQEELGDTAGARQTLEATVDALHRLGDVVGEATALGALGDLEAKTGMTLAAESLYRRGLRLVEDRPAPTISWRLHAGLGAALASRGGGALTDAVSELTAAISQVEQIAATLPIEERRAAFLTDKWDVYAELVFVELARGHERAAFEVSERMRARQMLDLIARGRIKGTAMSAEVTAREQDLRQRVAELTRLLQDPKVTDRALRGHGVRNLGAAREALVRSQEQYTELLLDIRRSAPAYATLVTGETVPLQSVMGRLAPDQALLEYLLTDSTSLVFVVTADTIAVLDLNVGRPAIASLVDFARGTLVRPAQAPARELWRAPLRRLYQQLLAPIEEAGLLHEKRRLLIVPHAELHYLPFEALVVPASPDRFLIEGYDVAYVPSASVWMTLGDRIAPALPERILALAPHDATLPGSLEEVQTISKLFGAQATVLIGAAATERAFINGASDYDVVHLATYGVLNKHNPLFSFVELNPDDDTDGRLEVHEVFGLDLEGQLIVLSACQTALGSGALADVPAGDDWVGLVRAFLYAGASNVLATIWAVEDQASARVMGWFYRSLKSGTQPAEALAQAKRAALRDPNTAHPFYWSGFVLVGSL